MSTFDYDQLEALWTQAGGSQSTEAVAAAVAMAESSGNQDAQSYNPVGGGTNVGLWQEETPGGVGNGYTVAQLEDPATNAALAVQGSSDGTNWGDWATYASGAYLQFLNGANSSTSGSSPASSDPFSNVKWYEPWTWANAPGDAETEIEQYAVIGLGVIVGLALIVGGLFRATGRRAQNPVTVLQDKAAPLATAAAAA